MQAGQLGPDGERFLDNIAIDGNIPAMLKTAIGVLQRNMKRRSVVDGAFRVDQWEYPVEALREAIVNALVHRDYGPSARGAQVQVELYPDRLVVRNSGRLYGRIEPSDLGFVPSTSARNQVLLKVLEDAPAEAGRTVCENRGSGISAMRISLENAGMVPPVFVDTISTFTVTLSNTAKHRTHEPGMSVRQKVLAVLGETPLSRTEISALTEAKPQVVSSILVQLRKSGMATLIGEPRSKNARWVRP